MGRILASSTAQRKWKLCYESGRGQMFGDSRDSSHTGTRDREFGPRPKTDDFFEINVCWDWLCRMCCCDFVDLQQLQMNSLRFWSCDQPSPPAQLAEVANAKRVVTISFVTAPLWPENPDKSRNYSWSASASRRESFYQRLSTRQLCLVPRCTGPISVSRETHTSSGNHN